MANQYRNKVIYFGETLIDLSSDTVTADKLLEGYTAHAADGSPITGTMPAPSGSGVVVTDTLDSHGGIIKEITAVNLGETTAVASDVAAGKYFFNAAGTKTLGTGTLAQPLKPYILRPDAELVRTWTHDSLAVEDDEATIPAYSTSAQTVIAAEALTPTITLSYADYNYYVVERFLTIPIYNTTTKAKGRPDYCASSYLYEVNAIDGSTFKSVEGTVYTSRTTNVASQTWTRAPYWSSATALSMYTATSYTVSQVATAPAISSGVLTISTPSLQMRGSTTYFTSSNWGKITDIRRQYVIELYRAPRSEVNLEGWGSYQNMLHIAGCINGTTNKLT